MVEQHTQDDRDYLKSHFEYRKAIRDLKHAISIIVPAQEYDSTLFKELEQKQISIPLSMSSPSQQRQVQKSINSGGVVSTRTRIRFTRVSLRLGRKIHDTMIELADESTMLKQPGHVTCDLA